MSRRTWLLLLNGLMFVIGSLTLWYYAHHQWQQRPPVWPDIRWELAVLSALLAVLYAFAYGFGWVLITRMMAIASSTPVGISIWGFSILGKYTPANVALVSYRVSAYMLRGDTKPQQVAASLAMESAMSVMAGLLLLVISVTAAGISAFGGNATGVNAAMAFAVLVALASLSLVPPIKRVLLRLLRLDQVAGHVTPLRVLVLLFYYLAAWTLIATSFFMVCKSMSADSIGFAQSAAIYTAAGLSGILAVFSPSGIGVREGVMVGLLANSIPFELALAIALGARVNSLIGDLAAITVGVVGLKVLGINDGDQRDPG